jgi:hypothetical protein
MDMTDWTTDQVATKIADITSGAGACIQCHVNGQGNFLASTDSTRVFRVLTTDQYYMAAYFVPDVSDLSQAKMVINSDAFRRVGTGVYPYIEHPRFDPASAGFNALTSFYNKTMARKTAGTCAPPRITSP